MNYNFDKSSYLQTTEMPADIITKILDSVKHHYFMNMLCILPAHQL